MMNQNPNSPGPELPVAETRPAAAACWQRYRAAQPGDAAEEDLVKQYVPLVKTVVGRLAMSLPSHVQTQDLYSAGMIGLLQAMRVFDPARGIPFESYARVRIRGAVLDELRRMDWAPRSVHVKARKIQQAMASVEMRSGKVASDAEVAAELRIAPGEYEQWLDDIRPATFICLDAPTNAEAEDSICEHEAVSDSGQPDPVDQVARAELCQLITERMSQLPELQRKVLALYYFEDLRLREIAAAFGFCESHICQLHAKAILSIKAYLERYETHGRAMAGISK